ncbi:MAG: hypothetical protein EPO07_08270 [Verrucomicrobia bacterium]|nr:MAG: hypothetical protein EPO07_08270 [Verrucomicrobiota bacterium]
MKLNRKLLEKLPVNLAPAFNREEWEPQEQALKEGKSFMEFYPESKVVRRGRNEIEIKMGEGYTVCLTVLAYGDVNHDGLEDVFLYVHHGTEGSMSYGFNVVLNRKMLNGKLEQVAW